jgi:hypothetical protein
MDVQLTEYEQLKAEQRDRLDRRDKLTRDAWVAAAAVVGAVVADLAHPAVLLLIPPVTLVLGWTYLRNDRMVTRIREYLVNDLRYRLAGELGVDADVLLRWEHGDGRSRRRGRRAARVAQAVADVVTFAGPAVAAAVAFLAVGGGPWTGVAAVELLAAAALVMAFLSTADVSR